MLIRVRVSSFVVHCGPLGRLGLSSSAALPEAAPASQGSGTPFGSESSASSGVAGLAAATAWHGDAFLAQLAGLARWEQAPGAAREPAGQVGAPRQSSGPLAAGPAPQAQQLWARRRPTGAVWRAAGSRPFVIRNPATEFERRSGSDHRASRHYPCRRTLDS